MFRAFTLVSCVLDEEQEAKNPIVTSNTKK